MPAPELTKDEEARLLFARKCNGDDHRFQWLSRSLTSNDDQRPPNGHPCICGATKHEAEYRCVDCAEYHEGDCDIGARMAFVMDCAMDAIDEIGHFPPEPGGRRWLIERGEYPADKFPGRLAED
jgi:hypothetical protein